MQCRESQGPILEARLHLPVTGMLRLEVMQSLYQFLPHESFIMPHMDGMSCHTIIPRPASHGRKSTGQSFFRCSVGGCALRERGRGGF